MHLKNKKGLTAMVDAMIFIVVMGLAVSALLYLQGSDEETRGESGEIVDNLFSTKIRMDDLIEYGDSSIISLTDMLAASMVIGDDSIKDYLETVMTSLRGIPGSYSMSIEYQGIRLELGTGDGVPISSSTKEFVVLYGDVMRIGLNLF